MNAIQCAFSTKAKRGVCHAINARQDVCSHRPEPLPDELVVRLLAAAHTGPSVGFVQPCSFSIVRDRTPRALRRHGSSRGPTPVLSSWAGFEVIGLVGIIKNSVRMWISVILDGLFTGADAPFTACRNPNMKRVMLADQQGTGPSHALVMGAMGRPSGLRLGEGSGAAVATGLLATAGRSDSVMCASEDAGTVHPERSGARQ